MDTGDLCRVPQAAVRHERARQNLGTGQCGGCIRILWVPGPWGQYSGKLLSINLRYKTGGGGRLLAKRSSDPRVAYSEVKVQVRDLVRASVPRENSFYQSPGGKWAQET